MKEGLGNHGKRAQMKTLTRLAVRWNAGKTGERKRTRFVSPHKRKICHINVHDDCEDDSCKRHGSCVLGIIGHFLYDKCALIIGQLLRNNSFAV